MAVAVEERECVAIGDSYDAALQDLSPGGKARDSQNIEAVGALQKGHSDSARRHLMMSQYLTRGLRHFRRRKATVLIPPFIHTLAHPMLANDHEPRGARCKY